MVICADGASIPGYVPAGRHCALISAETVVLRTAADTTAARKVHDVIVAFEVDHLHAATSLGWSVVITGRATRVADPELIARYRKVPLEPWAPGERDQFVTITTEMIEGRRVSRAARAASGDLRS